MTAAGKSAFALELAEGNPLIEIVNADSLQIYREMNIGTAKPDGREMKSVPHHLIDIRDPSEPFTAGDFMRAALQAIAEIEARGKRALIVGGSGFYLKALLHGIWEAPAASPEIRERLQAKPSNELFQDLQARDPESAERIGMGDRYRLIRALEIIELTGKTPSQLRQDEETTPDPRFELWCLDRADEELQKRIERRTAKMLENGLIAEYESLREKFGKCRPLSAVGYVQVGDYLAGKKPEGRKPRPGIPGLQDEIVLATRQLVKSQRTWFRGRKDAKWFVLEEEREKLLSAARDIYSG